MQIVINDNGVIMAYATTGKLHGGVDFYGDFPTDFAPDKYRWNKLNDTFNDTFADESPTYIFREIETDEKITDENGEGMPYKTTKVVREVGEVVLNPDYTDTSLEECRVRKIQETKIKLAEWLENNPYLYKDGKYYSVTEEKQALLNGNLASYERATNARIEYPLRWNSTGSECVEFSYSDLLALSLSIARYVAPKVSIQQSIELQIKACDTIEQIDAIEISYDDTE